MRKLKGGQFVAGQGVTIFDLFDLVELQFYYRQFAEVVPLAKRDGPAHF